MRPDPTIYDQYYLMGLGLAVTWQNPDIEIFQNGAPVPSAYELQTATDYIIKARIYNASTGGFVYKMPVVFSYLSFGMGTQSNLIPGPLPTVTLGVKGSPNGVDVIEMPWTTPAVPGHYCIQVSFAYIDDANPFNNLGQDNTQVLQAHSPAPFAFQLRNAARLRRAFRFEVDTFQIAPPPACPVPAAPAAGAGRGGFAPSRGAPAAGVALSTLARNSRAAHPLPDGWTIGFDPAQPVLDPEQEITVTGTITPADTFHGTLPVNIHAFCERALAGGVTIVVNRA